MVSNKQEGGREGRRGEREGRRDGGRDLSKRFPLGVVGKREERESDSSQLERAFTTRRYINFKSRGNLLFEGTDPQRVGGRSAGDEQLERSELEDVTCFTLI